MKKLPFLLVLLLALPVLTFAQSKKNLAAVKEVEALERQRFAAQVSKDYAYLDKVFADDLIYTHSNGKQNNKTEYVQSIKDGKSVYDKVALVLTDLEMPEMDGFTLTRNIKSSARFGNLPVVIHSSLSGNTNEEHVRKVRADAYVAKFSAEDLSRTLRTILKQ